MPSMSTKRPRPPINALGSSSSYELQRKRLKPDRFISEKTRLIRIHIIPAKIDSSTLFELGSLLEDGKTFLAGDENALYQLMSSADEHDADVIITAVRMKKRLERHVDWDVAVCPMFLSSMSP